MHGPYLVENLVSVALQEWVLGRSTAGKVRAWGKNGRRGPQRKSAYGGGTMTKETRTLLGLAGSLCLVFGTFAPFASLPIVGSLTILRYNGIVGSLLVVAGFIGGYFAIKAAFRYVLYTGIVGIALTAFAAIWFESNLSRMQSQIGTELGNNLFAGLATAALQSVQLSWGVAILGIGAVLLVISAVMKSPGTDDTTSVTINPRIMRWVVGVGAVIVVGIVGYNLLGGMFIGSTVITTSNQAQIEEKVAGGHMSDTDKSEFSSAMARPEYSSAGKTVNQVIADQRSFEVAQKAEQERAAQLAAEERAKREATLKSMLGALTVGVVSKSFVAADPLNSGTYEDQIAITFAFKNTAPKDIRAFKGSIVFKTLMGDFVTQTSLERDKTILAGHSVTWDGALRYNQFEEKDTKLKSTDLKDMKVEWHPKSILFADGTKLEVSENSNTGNITP